MKIRRMKGLRPLMLDEKAAGAAETGEGMDQPIRDYVCVDLETTGLHPKYDKIIEIGAVKVRGGRETAVFSTLVNPGRILSEHTRELTGIRDDQLSGAPKIEKILPELLAFMEGLPLLGHSLLFDYSFLKKAAVNAGLDFEACGMDTLKLSRKFLAELESRNLGFLCRHFQIPHTAHRALGDAQATSRLYEILCGRFFTPEQAKEFEPRPLIYQVKKDQPASRGQKERLYRLAGEHRIELGVDVERLTRSEASRLADQIRAGWTGDGKE